MAKAAVKVEFPKITTFKYFFPERARLLHAEQPLFEDLSQNPDWIAEPKFNGSRLQLHYLDGEWQFWNRHHSTFKKFTPAPELLADLNGLKLKGYWLFDGELRHNKVKGIRQRLVFYDLFISAGDLLLGTTFEDRRGILEVLFHYCGPDTGDLVDLSPQFEGDFRKRFEAYRDTPEIEGLVLKNKKGHLNLGRTSAMESTWQFKVRYATNSVRF